MSEKIRTVYIKKREIAIWTCPKCHEEHIEPYPDTIKEMGNIRCGYCHFNTSNFEFEKEE